MNKTTDCEAHCGTLALPLGSQHSVMSDFEPIIVRASPIVHPERRDSSSL